MTATTWCLGTQDRRLAAAGGVLGGVLLGAGAALPWLTFFAGLHRLSGLAGPNGWGLLAAGTLCVLAGGWLLRGNSTVARGALLAAGAVALPFTVWLMLGLRETLHALAREQPMLVAQPGYGLAACAVGALLVAWAAWPRRRG